MVNFYIYYNIHTHTYIHIYIYIYCKDQNWYESKAGVDPGPRSPNNEFIECRSES